MNTSIARYISKISTRLQEHRHMVIALVDDFNYLHVPGLPSGDSSKKSSSSTTLANLAVKFFATDALPLVEPYVSSILSSFSASLDVRPILDNISFPYFLNRSAHDPAKLYKYNNSVATHAGNLTDFHLFKSFPNRMKSAADFRTVLNELNTFTTLCT